MKWLFSEIIRKGLACCFFFPMLWSCQDKKEENAQPKPQIRFEKPAHFPEPAYDLSSNPITQAGFELGRALFYEPMFSRDNTISCGSCHQQSAGFTHHGHALSHGIDDKIGFRNAQPVMNLAWGKSFMWDGGVINLDLFPPAPVANPVEMDESMANVLKKLRHSGRYLNLYNKAFGDTSISFARTVKAMSQFMLMCISAESPYDLWRLGKGTLSHEQQEGYELVKSKCGICHSGELFTDESFRNNGLGDGRGRKDFGRESITLQATDKYKFKVPTLRNLGFTAPYMHDGRFLTLEAVLDHYIGGVKNTPNLDSALVQNGALGIAINPPEKQKIIAFLNSLNDENFRKKTELGEAAAQ
jgi:cytochrome c peroxidase